jgi:hypothetical protein
LPEVKERIKAGALKEKRPSQDGERVRTWAGISVVKQYRSTTSG